MKKITHIFTKVSTPFLIFMLVIFVSGFNVAQAAGFTTIKDTMSSHAKLANSDHTVTWTLTNTHTVSAGDTVTLDFTDADFVTSAAGTWQTTDFTYSDSNHSTIAPLDVGAAPSCSATDNYTVTITAATNTFLFTACSGWTISAADDTITFVIKGATGGTGTLANANVDTNSSQFNITNTGSNTDSGRGAVVIETNNVVTVTATVDPTLTLAISSPSVALGTLSTAAAGTGSHTAQVSTNASGGFLLTYDGATLTNITSPSNTIAAYGSQASSVPGTAGFGINMVANTTPFVGANLIQNGGVCAAVPADYGTADKFSYTADATTNLTNQIVPADCTYTISYVANINSTTVAGSYSTAITYIASGTF